MSTQLLMFLMFMPPTSVCWNKILNVEVAMTWKRLSWSTVLVLDKNKNVANEAKLVKEASQIEISCSVLSSEDTVLSELERSSAQVTIVGDVAQKVTEKVVSSHHLLPYSLLVVSWADPGTFLDHFRTANVSLGFFVVQLRPNAGVSQLWRVQTFAKQKVVIRNALQVDQSGRYTETYNLEGLELTSSTLPYPPWLYMHDCKANNTDCRIDGILAEVFDVLKELLNFTLRVDLAHHWGAVPKTGSYVESNPTFHGAMGAVINRDCDIGLSAWVERLDRRQYLDFLSSFMTDDMVVTINRKLPPADFTLFLRPFTLESWLSIAATTLILALLLLLPNIVNRIARINVANWSYHSLVILSGRNIVSDNF